MVHSLLMNRKLINRKFYLQKIKAGFKVHPVIAILGPRGCGKTTLARQYAKSVKKIHIFDLENPEDLAALDNPTFLFANLKGDIIIDEIQRRPNLFPILRFLIDKEKRGRKILILGSASRDLIQQSTESLAGRIDYIELTPFTLKELPSNKINMLWERGGFPLSFLASKNKYSAQWIKSYISTFLERDIPSLGIRIPVPAMRRFWNILAHYHGQIINYSELGSVLGVSDHTVRRYLDILTETFIIRQLFPWHENIKKRQVKRPKIYFRDSGLYHTMLKVESKRTLISHPKLGASWEGFALEQFINFFDIDEAYFWAVHSQGELDLFFQKNGKRYGVEFKFSESPKISHSMKYSLKHLKLDQLYCIYLGDQVIHLQKNILACGLRTLKKINII